jgi:hypothetical protein
LGRGGIRDGGIAGYSPASLIRSIIVLVVGATEQSDKSKSLGMSTEQLVATGLPISVKSRWRGGSGRKAAGRGFFATASQRLSCPERSDSRHREGSPATAGGA